MRSSVSSIDLMSVLPPVTYNECVSLYTNVVDIGWLSCSYLFENKYHLNLIFILLSLNFLLGDIFCLKICMHNLVFVSAVN